MQYITPLLPAYPELFLLAMVCVILVADLFVSDANRIATYALTQAALLGCFLITFLTATTEPVTTFSDMFVDDLMADVLKLLVYLGVMVMLVYSRPYIAVRGMFRGEFFVLVLFATLGMMVMISANHLLTLYLGLELLSLSLYALVALQRDSADSTEAAMKYFV
jgi:NADH-quinone oxidoreductase subunit N